MLLQIEKVMETKDWSNKDFSPKFLMLSLKEDDKRPGEIKIYFADKPLIFEKGLFEGLPFLSFKADPKGNFERFKLMPGIALDRRYAIYYVKVDQPELIVTADLTHE